MLPLAVRDHSFHFPHTFANSRPCSGYCKRQRAETLAKMIEVETKSFIPIVNISSMRILPCRIRKHFLILEFEFLTGEHKYFISLLRGKDQNCGAKTAGKQSNVFYNIHRKLFFVLMYS